MSLFDDLKNKAASAVNAAAQKASELSQKKNADFVEHQGGSQSCSGNGSSSGESLPTESFTGPLKFEIKQNNDMNFVHVYLEHGALKTEAGALYYMQGDLDMTVEKGAGVVGAMLTNETIVRPIYRGTGEIVLEPSYGEFTIFDLEGTEWFINRGCYYASEASIETEISTNKISTALFSGAGLFQTRVKGYGKVVITSDGPLKRIDLVNDKLTVDGGLAVAWSNTLDFKIERTTKGLLNTVLAKEGLFNTVFEGTGTIYLCPAPNKLAYLLGQMDKGFETLAKKK